MAFESRDVLGDIDTHGYAMHRARRHLPQLRSVLMDEATLLQFPTLWSTEVSQSSATELPYLQTCRARYLSGLAAASVGALQLFICSRLRW